MQTNANGDGPSPGDAEIDVQGWKAHSWRLQILYSNESVRAGGMLAKNRGIVWPDVSAMMQNLKEASSSSPAATKASPVARAQRALDAARANASSRRTERDERLRQDAIWARAAQAGDAEAFRKLVEANQGRLFAVALGMLKDRDEAMDAVQDAFIKAHAKLQSFEGNSAFSTWLHRICVNLCIDRQRARARRRSVQLEDARESDLSEDNIYGGDEITTKVRGQNPLQNATNKELGGEIQRAIALLSEEHRSVLLLREVEGMSYEEIAATLDIPKGTIMSRLFHARRNMQRHLGPFLGLSD